MSTRKGDYVAVEETHSSASLHGPATHYTTWHIARVAKSSRDGIVKQVAFYPNDWAHDIKRFKLRVMTLPNKQTEASRLFAATNYGSSYDTVEAIRDAILGA
jgi:hypothetical protein